MLVIVINYVDVTWSLYEAQAHSAKQHRMFFTLLAVFHS